MSDKDGLFIPPKVWSIADIRMIDKVILCVLWNSHLDKNVEINLPQLAKRLEISKTYLTNRVRKLVEWGFLMKTRTNSLSVDFTEKGKLLFEIATNVAQIEIAKKEPEIAEEILDKSIVIKDLKTSSLKKNYNKKKMEVAQRDLFGGIRSGEKDTESTTQNQLFIFSNNKLAEYGFGDTVTKTFGRFLSNYLTIRKTPTIQQVTILLEKVKKFKDDGYEDDDICEVINNSILKNYSDLYEIKNIREKKLQRTQVAGKRKIIKDSGVKF